MSPQQDNIQALENAIMAEARREMRQLLDKAQREAAQIKQQAQAQLGPECQTILQQAHEEADTIQTQAVASAQLEAQTLKLQRRERLLASVFETAQQQLQTIPQSSDYVYADIVRRLIQEAVKHLRANELRILADPVTQAILTPAMLDELNTTLGIKLQLGDTRSQGTGVVLETLDGHRRYDNTLETRLARMIESLRAAVYHKLRGEKL